ncbi:metal-sensitive transcriptional regulator [Salimicrobium halophilum]|uniref:DNA-binding transcriptional regulator, FrmR family n=1 Tax=Salimicrobium halophilum TaxID=86666 RepID=A0A1G8SYF8_9BACI|nr:metal-sensitive transcriptional regulator [Salimicrobium halophilum]SDJ34206.1 DNA-binding transcriptional regulator, FrmR family [Salimicrobium halophilum]
MEYSNKEKNRIKRLEGQLRGVLRMMEEGKDCKDIITQLSASRSAIDRSIGVLVSSNLVECVREEQNQENQEEAINEAVQLLVKSR